MPVRRYPPLLIYDQLCGELLFDPLDDEPGTDRGHDQEDEEPSDNTG